MWCDAIYTPQNMKGGNILPEEVKQFLDEEMIGRCHGQYLEWWFGVVASLTDGMLLCGVW